MVKSYKNLINWLLRENSNTFENKRERELAFVCVS